MPRKKTKHAPKGKGSPKRTRRRKSAAERRADAIRTKLASGPIPLSDFNELAGGLSRKQMETLVDQALVLIDDVYVHLPLKRAMHAIDPSQRLKLLRHRLTNMSERRFHDEMISIFTRLRDLHTNYTLPDPYRGKIAFLPFLAEEFFEDGRHRYLVSKIFAGFSDPDFKKGVELVSWSGVPIDRAVEINADREAGSNEDARHARGLEALTVRPLTMSTPPDEEFVLVGFSDGSDEWELQIDWRVFDPQPAPEAVNPNSAKSPAARALGVDAKTEAVRRAKKFLFNPKAMKMEAHVADLRHKGARRGSVSKPMRTKFAATSTMPDIFAFRTVDTASGTFGYIRIWTFSVQDDDDFVSEFVRLASMLPDDGLIIDVRGNGGGLITAGERLLQVLTPHPIEPEHLHFINTPLTLRLCRENSFLAEWAPSIEQSVEIGTTFSRGFPIEPKQRYNDIGQKVRGPVVLITDALCYSTTDIFAAGFQDHGIGPILGVHGNTGAGGANVWTHNLLRRFLPGPRSPFTSLPKGASFRVSVRRTTRVGPHSGVPLEDLGVVPTHRHPMTRDDLMNSNVDLLNAAGALLADLPKRRLDLSVRRVAGNLEVEATTLNLDRLDALIDGRPRHTLDTTDGSNAFQIPNVGTAPKELTVRGFRQGQLAAVNRVAI